VDYSVLRILLVAVLIAVNGFFAGAEVALLSVRQSRLRQMAENGRAGAQAALNLLANPGRLLSVVQVGVTLGSLGLGWAGEDAVYQMLGGLYRPFLTSANEHLLHGVAFALSFLIISYFHVVLGEVLPKNIAISKADRLAILVAPALLLFYRVSLPFVVIIERSANALSRSLHLGSSAGGHSAEELKLIVSSSRGQGYVPEAQEEMIHRVLDMEAVLAREIMTPRNQIISISADASLDQVLDTMIEQQHSRLPVYDTTPERIIGILHYKDLLPVWHERRRAIQSGGPSKAFRVTRLLRPHHVVPETKPLTQLLEEFQHGKSHMGMVVDEFGTITGLLTVEDILEQIVGPIEDEYDEKTHHGPPADELELSGATRILELESEYGIEVPNDAGYETLAGFVLFRLGRIPRGGEAVEHDGRRFTVLEMDRNRIAKVRIQRIPEQSVPSAV
jgi:putative hemolysin